MGRIKKYQTEDERILKQREYSKKYYWSNKEKIDEKLKQKYHLELIKKYASDIPGYYETIKKKYNCK